MPDTATELQVTAFCYLLQHITTTRTIKRYLIAKAIQKYISGGIRRNMPDNEYRKREVFGQLD